MGLARAERLRLADLAERLGPDAPTLCTGWTTRDLVAHLVLRDRQPLAVPGTVLPFAAPLTDALQRRLDGVGYDDLLDRLREGPPRWSPVGLPGLEEQANLVEFFVHCEDVRRAQPDGAGARHDVPELDDPLWARLRLLGRVLVRRARGVAVHALRRDGASLVLRGGRGPVVTVCGTPGELTLLCWGRGEVAEVDVTGEPAAVAAFEAARLGP